MKNVIFVVALMMASINCFSQFIKSNSGNLVDADFEFSFDIVYVSGYLPDIFGYCSIISSTSNWELSGINLPEVCYVNEFALNYRSYSGRNHAVLYKVIQDDVVIQPKLNAYFTNLTPQKNYKLTFYQVNLSSSNESNLELDSGFEITIGDEIFFEHAIAPFPTSYPYQQGDWVKSTITFCATQTTLPFSIAAEFLNEESNNLGCYLGLDYIKLEENFENTETCDIPCPNCTSFELVREQEYMISGWVKQTETNYADIRVPTYGNAAFIEVMFYDSFENELPGALTPFYPAGEIIDGWQRITGVFTVPATAGEISIGLMNSSTKLAFFDDIRVHPLNGNLKSFVYDQASQKLMAELDENNYATFYEYDKEGGLVRVKKETEKGVFTIQETRSSNRKKED